MFCQSGHFSRLHRHKRYRPVRYHMSMIIIDRHPSAPNVWILGDGSGHGFKMGPALGEMVAKLIYGDAEPDLQFGLRRFAAPPDGGWDRKWS